jgi:hypothetical protein
MNREQGGIYTQITDQKLQNLAPKSVPHTIHTPQQCS